MLLKVGESQCGRRGTHKNVWLEVGYDGSIKNQSPGTQARKSEPKQAGRSIVAQGYPRPAPVDASRVKGWLQMNSVLACLVETWWRGRGDRERRSQVPRLMY